MNGSPLVAGGKRLSDTLDVDESQGALSNPESQIPCFVSAAARWQYQAKIALNAKRCTCHSENKAVPAMYRLVPHESPSAFCCS